MQRSISIVLQFLIRAHVMVRCFNSIFVLHNSIHLTNCSSFPVQMVQKHVSKYKNIIILLPRLRHLAIFLYFRYRNNHFTYSFSWPISIYFTLSLSPFTWRETALFSYRTFSPSLSISYQFLVSIPPRICRLSLLFNLSNPFPSNCLYSSSPSIDLNT